MAKMRILAPNHRTLTHEQLLQEYRIMAKKGKKSQAAESSTEGKKDPTERIELVPYELIEADPTFNVRKQDDDGKYPDIKSLTADIRANGLLSPLTVRPIAGGRFGLVAGYRRHQALLALREGKGPSALKLTAPCVVKEYDDLQAYLVNITENLSREDIDMFDLGERAAFLAKKFGLTGGELAKKLGYHRNHVNFCIAIQGLPKAILKDIYSLREQHKSDKKVKTPPADVLKQLCFRCKTDKENDPAKQAQAYDLWKSGGVMPLGPGGAPEPETENKFRGRKLVNEMIERLEKWSEVDEDSLADELERSPEWVQGAKDALQWVLQQKGHKRENLVADCEFEEEAEAAE